jgi:excisionase family DNA binding protein
METTPPNESLVDATAVGTRLGVKKSTVYDQVAKGVLPHVRLWSGTRRTIIRFRMSEIEAFIRERTVQPAGRR